MWGLRGRPGARSQGRGALRRRLAEAGQTATEFMLVISVITIATAGATYYFLGDNGPWAQGLSDFNGDLQKQIDRGYIGGEQAPGGGG